MIPREKIIEKIPSARTSPLISLCSVYCLKEIYEIDSSEPRWLKCTYHQSRIVVSVMHYL